MKKQQKKLIHYDGENPDEKRKKIDIQFQVMEETKQNMENFKKEVEQASKKDKEEKSKISEITQNQHQNL